jgi:hypothetical protein
LGASGAMFAAKWQQLQIGAPVLKVATVVRVVTGIYAAAIATQLITNLAKALRGEPTRPVQWIRSGPPQIFAKNDGISGAFGAPPEGRAKFGN